MAILRVKQRLGENVLFYGRICIFCLAIVSVTQCYDIKSSIVVKSLKHVTHRQNGTLYFLIMVVRVF